MMLSADPLFPSRRTYVVKFRNDATLHELRGRLENLVTCKQSEFASAHELFEVIARDFESGAAEPPSDS